MTDEYAVVGVDEARLKKPSQTVTVRNTHVAQTNVVVDRYRRPHTLQPGEAKEMEMLAEDIAFFQRERMPGRFREIMVQEGSLYHVTRREAPLHPILIEGIPQLTEPADGQKRRRE